MNVHRTIIEDLITQIIEEMKGIVKWYDETKGFGFIKTDDGDKDIFVHRTGVQGSGLEEGQEVEFEIEEGKKGPVAVNVTAI